MHANSLLALAVALVLTGVDRAATGEPTDRVHSINGHGTWALDTGDVYENHQPYIESTTINAWLDADGTAGGTIVWMDTYNGLLDDHGEAYSGYTWQVDVDTFIVISENEVYVGGTIFHSNVETDIGGYSGFYVYDGGPGSIDGILWYYPADDEIARPVLKGNFKID